MFFGKSDCKYHKRGLSTLANVAPTWGAEPLNCCSLVSTATWQCSGNAQVHPGRQGCVGLWEIDYPAVFAYCSLVASQWNRCPALHNACTANIINLIYHWGMCTNRECQRYSICFYKQKWGHLINVRHLVSLVFPKDKCVQEIFHLGL